MSLPLEDYALIGNTHTAALVGRDGSIDWFCAPRFDSPAMFAGLLGRPANGRWKLAPKGRVLSATRRYREDTLILETRFQAETGAATVIDFMPASRQDDRTDIARIVVGVCGRVEMTTELTPRFDYGHSVPWLRLGNARPTAIAGPDAVVVTSPVPLETDNAAWNASFTIGAGERLGFGLTWHAGYRPPPPPLDLEYSLTDTEQRWKDWAARGCYRGPWRRAVGRSLITLKALTHKPTGGIVAAPTTSLPEALGGVRNWDYRFCWLRDATFTLYSLLSSGYRDEAVAWREWLLRSAAGRPAELQIMYGLAGERRLNETDLPWLQGYEGSQPVRVGNEAHRQLQLDVFGEVMDCLHAARKAGVEADGEVWEAQKLLLDFLEGHWEQPDEGLWEVRGGRRHFTHSKVMAWVALDRAIKGIESFGMDGPLAHWRALRATIHADVLTQGWNAERKAFVQYYGGQELDAALLMIPLVGFLPCEDPRVKATVTAIERELMVDGLVQRYSTDPKVEGLPPGEGTFLACSFWLADNFAMSGRRDDACRLFERLLALRNDVGLLSEEYDTQHHRLVGNFPQAFSHVALVNTAHNLATAFGPARQRAES